MDIKKSEFTISAATVSQCPKDTKPEFAFIGRSNVGKSSLINMLCNHKGLAKTSATPGKTLLINHFIINNDWYLVDLPGYGFAKRSKTVQKKLDQMITSYILQRQQLVNTLRKTLFQIMTTLLQNAPADDPVYRFLDKKRSQGKPYYVYMTAGANKFLRIYYGKVKECLHNLEQES